VILAYSYTIAHAQMIIRLDLEIYQQGPMLGPIIFINSSIIYTAFIHDGPIKIIIKVFEIKKMMFPKIIYRYQGIKQRNNQFNHSIKFGICSFQWNS